MNQDFRTKANVFRLQKLKNLLDDSIGFCHPHLNRIKV